MDAVFVCRRDIQLSVNIRLMLMLPNLVHAMNRGGILIGLNVLLMETVKCSSGKDFLQKDFITIAMDVLIKRIWRRFCDMEKIVQRHLKDIRSMLG